VATGCVTVQLQEVPLLFMQHGVDLL
jgi:hypothetical protein